MLANSLTLGELRRVHADTSAAANRTAFLHALVTATEDDRRRFLCRKCHRIVDQDLRRVLCSPLASECHDILRCLAQVDALKCFDPLALCDAWEALLRDGTVSPALVVFATSASAVMASALNAATDAMSTGSYSDYSEYSESHDDASSSGSEDDEDM